MSPERKAALDKVGRCQPTRTEFEHQKTAFENATRSARKEIDVPREESPVTQVDGSGVPGPPTEGRLERTLLADQLAYMRNSRLAILGWIALTSAVAALAPISTRSMGWLVIVLLSAIGPVIAFAIAWRRSARFRARMLSLDLGAVTLFKTGRILGLAWLVVYSYHKLPAAFAFWAGGIDVIIGGTATTAAYALAAVRPFPRRAFAGWHLFGMFDFVVALPLLVLFSPTAAGVLAGAGPTTEAALQFPLSFIAMAGVPLMWCTHLVALLQLRHKREPRVYPLLHPAGTGTDGVLPNSGRELAAR
jgi:hypothetical protein